MSDNPPGPRSGERIAKLLARAGVASRREIERMIAEGRVRLDDQPVTTPATVLPDLRGVTVDGKAIKAPEAARLFLFHKPSGLITAERDPAGRPTIYTALRNALPPGAPRVMPVGRLDLNTEGLLLLTNDGELKRALELPASGVPRTYRARTFGDITQARLEELIEGVEIDGIRYGKIDANMERRTGRNQWIELTLTEGKNREVRRVLEHLGLQVSRLLRVAYGPFVLGDLPRGAAGEIAPAEVEKFRRTLGLAPQDPAAVRKTLRVDAEPEGRRKARPAPARAKPSAERPARPGAKPPVRKAAAALPADPAPARAERRPARPQRLREDEGSLLGRGELRRRGDRPAGGPPPRPGGPGKPRPPRPRTPKPRGRRP
ncbi:MAG TPA: pseudouridine synthase [Novosphingobium sp.]